MVYLIVHITYTIYLIVHITYTIHTTYNYNKVSTFDIFSEYFYFYLKIRRK